MAAPAEEPMAPAAMEVEAVEVHPLAGEWNHTLDSPEGKLTGMMMFEVVDGVLVGTVHGEGLADGVPLEDLVFDAESGKVTGSFDSGGFGIMDLDITLESADTITGFITVLDYDIDVPLQGSRADSEE